MVPPPLKIEQKAVNFQFLIFITFRDLHIKNETFLLRSINLD